MKLENQVSSLELSKKLKELGVKQESLFRWQGYLQPKKIKTCELVLNIEPIYEPYDVYSAFTVAELGAMLPELKTTSEKKDKGYWNVYVMGDDGYRSAAGGETEADARAKMLIYLIENNLISL